PRIVFFGRWSFSNPEMIVFLSSLHGSASPRSGREPAGARRPGLLRLHTVRPAGRHQDGVASAGSREARRRGALHCQVLHGSASSRRTPGR
ncbi:MAG: hypothetical protein PVG32_04415, partial [Anaerolineales bacterium]